VFNIDRQDYNRKFVIVTEGQFDAIAIDGVGIMTNEPNESQVARLNALDREVIVVPDKDRPGAKMLKAAIDNGWSASLPPWDDDVKDVADAVKKYGEDSLKAHGIVPWHIDVMVKRLTAAFRAEDYDRILQLSADLGHYIGDAHVPLHTTKNYNGQLTNQKGIHGFWESRLPELFNDNYDFFVGKAKYIEDPLAEAWQAVAESFAAKDSVLLFEAELNAKYPQDRKYAFENRGASLMKVYSAEYSDEYHKMLDGMVERRMRKAIVTVGSMWFTAWVNAGQPDLDKYKDRKISKETEAELADEDKHYKEGKLNGRSCD
jgi:hypothetical protein